MSYWPQHHIVGASKCASMLKTIYGTDVRGAGFCDGCQALHRGRHIITGAYCSCPLSRPLITTVFFSWSASMSSLKTTRRHLLSKLAASVRTLHGSISKIIAVAPNPSPVVPATLLSLPVELRVQIYQWVFEDFEIYRFARRAASCEDGVEVKFGHGMCPSILLVSRKINQEALEVMHEYAEVVVNGYNGALPTPRAYNWQMDLSARDLARTISRDESLTIELRTRLRGQGRQGREGGWPYVVYVQPENLRSVLDQLDQALANDISMSRHLQLRLRISTGHLCTMIEGSCPFPQAQHSVYQALGILISERPVLQLPSTTFELYKDEDGWVPQTHQAYWRSCGEQWNKFDVPAQFNQQPFSQAGFVEALEAWSDYDGMNDDNRLVDDLRSGQLRSYHG